MARNAGGEGIAIAATTRAQGWIIDARGCMIAAVAEGARVGSAIQAFLVRGVVVETLARVTGGTGSVVCALTPIQIRVDTKINGTGRCGTVARAPRSSIDSDVIDHVIVTGSRSRETSGGGRWCGKTSHADAHSACSGKGNNAIVLKELWLVGEIEQAELQ